MRKFKFFKELVDHMPPALVAGAVIELGKMGAEKLIEHKKGANKKMEPINRQEKNSYPKIIENLGKSANDEVTDTDNDNVKSQSFKP